MSEVAGSQELKDLVSFTPGRDTAVTIGVFDGVHLGHRHLVKQLLLHSEAMDYVPVAVTFQSHPQEVLQPQLRLTYLTTLEEKVALLKELGLALVVPLHFTRELAQVTARRFVEALQRYLRMKSLVLGPDFALGKGREGDVVALHRLGEEMGFTVFVASPEMLEGEVISSTAIRQALAQGDMAKVRRMLGRPYGLRGPVVHGAERGRNIGFPTANLDINSHRGLPADGVYVTRAHVEGKAYPSVTNVGTNPTFGQQERTVEVYLLDTDMELYGKEVQIDVLERLRGEQRFDSAQALVVQIEKDVSRAKEILRSEK